MTSDRPHDRARALVADHEARVVAADPDARRLHGRYYTPEVLVRLVASRVLGPLVARAGSCEAILALRVLDPSCGAGAFLLGALEVLAGALVARGMSEPDARARVVEECLVGLDTDEGALELAGRALAVASGGARARHLTAGDALADGGLARAAGVPGLDAVLGNPPYRREKDARPELARARATELGRRHGSGKMDLWFLFAHAALEALPPGGRHGFVVPAYWLESHGASRFRAHLREALALDLLVELGARRFFADVSGRHVVYVGERDGGEGGTRGLVERVELAPVRAGKFDPGSRAALEGAEAAALERALVLGEAHPAVSRRLVPEAELWLADGRVARASALASHAARVEARGVVASVLAVAEGVTPGPEAWTRSVARRAALALGTTAERLEEERGVTRGEGVFVLSPEEVARAGLDDAPERAWLLPWAAPHAIPAYPGRPTATARILYLARTREVPAGVLAHLERFRPALDRRRETLTGRRPWFELHWPRERSLFSGPRALMPRMVARPRAAFVEGDLVTGESVLVLRFPDRERTRLAAALLGTAPLGAWLLERAKRRGVGIDVSVALARRIPWPPALLEGDLARVEPVARALEAADQPEADRLAWELY